MFDIISQNLCLLVKGLGFRSGPKKDYNSFFLRIASDVLSHVTQGRSVRHVGGAMRGAGAEQLPAVVRPVLEAEISNNALRFMYALGYKLDYEMLRIGFSFQLHRTVPIAVTITIAVTALHRLPKTHAVDDVQPITPGLQMVHLSAPASPDNYTDVVNAISALAEHLAP